MTDTFQGSVISAEVLYLGLKIKEGFQSITDTLSVNSKTIGPRMEQMSIALNDLNNSGMRRPLRAMNDQQQADQHALRLVLNGMLEAMKPTPKPMEPPAASPAEPSVDESVPPRPEEGD